MTMSENAIRASVDLSRLIYHEVDIVDHVGINRAGRKDDIKTVTELLTKYHAHLEVYKLFDYRIYMVTDNAFEYLIRYTDNIVKCGGIEWYDRLNRLINRLVHHNMSTKIKILMKYLHPASPYAIKNTMSVQDVVGCGMVTAAKYGRTEIITLLSGYLDSKYFRWRDMRDYACNAETLTFIEDMAIAAGFYERLSNGKYDSLSPKDGKHLKLSVEW